MSVKDAAQASGPCRRVAKGANPVLRFLYPMSDEENGWNYLMMEFDSESRRSNYYEVDSAPKKAREIFFAVAYDTEAKTVDVWELKKSVVKQLSDYDDDYETITDRAYKIRRRGDGFDTEYNATPMNPSEFKKLSKLAEESKGMLSECLNELLMFTDDEDITSINEEIDEIVDVDEWEDED